MNINGTNLSQWDKRATGRAPATFPASTNISSPTGSQRIFFTLPVDAHENRDKKSNIVLNRQFRDLSIPTDIFSDSDCDLSNLSNAEIRAPTPDRDTCGFPYSINDIINKGNDDNMWGGMEDSLSGRSKWHRRGTNIFSYDNSGEVHTPHKSFNPSQGDMNEASSMSDYVPLLNETKKQDPNRAGTTCPEGGLIPLSINDIKKAAGIIDYDVKNFISPPRQPHQSITQGKRDISQRNYYNSATPSSDAISPLSHNFPSELRPTFKLDTPPKPMYYVVSKHLVSSTNNSISRYSNNSKLTPQSSYKSHNSLSSDKSSVRADETPVAHMTAVEHRAANTRPLQHLYHNGPVVLAIRALCEEVETTSHSLPPPRLSNTMAWDGEYLSGSLVDYLLQDQYIHSSKIPEMRSGAPNRFGKQKTRLSQTTNTTMRRASQVEREAAPRLSEEHQLEVICMYNQLHRAKDLLNIAASLLEKREASEPNTNKPIKDIQQQGSMDTVTRENTLKAEIREHLPLSIFKPQDRDNDDTDVYPIHATEQHYKDSTHRSNGIPHQAMYGPYTSQVSRVYRSIGLLTPRHAATESSMHKSNTDTTDTHSYNNNNIHNTTINLTPSIHAASVDHDNSVECIGGTQHSKGRLGELDRNRYAEISKLYHLRLQQRMANIVK